MLILKRKKNPKHLLFSLIALFVYTHAFAAEQSQGIWVAVRVQEKVDKLQEYHGLLDNKTFWDITTNKSKTGFFRLQNTVWISPEGKIVPLARLDAAGQLYGYTNDAFFKIENVFRLIPLESSFVDAHLKKGLLK